MKPKWQRARIIEPCNEYGGAEIWVRTGPPEIASGRQIGNNQPVIAELSFRTNLVNHDPEGAMVRQRYLELLARDENDFADDVPLIPWEQFLEQCRKEPPCPKN